MPLSSEEREQFLAEPHVAALSVACGAGRAPLTVPIWYQYTPGGEAWVLSGTTARKTRLIAEAGRFTLMVQRMTPSIRYVSVEGAVPRTVPMTDELLWELSARYLPERQVASYVEMAKRDHGPQVAIYLQPRRWLSADLGTL